MEEIFKVPSQGSVRQRFVEQEHQDLQGHQGFFSRDKVQQRFVEQNMKLVQVLVQNRVPRRLVEQNMKPIFRVNAQDRVQTAFGGAEHGTLHGLRPGQSSTAFCGTEHGTLQGVRPGQEFNSVSWSRTS